MTCKNVKSVHENQFFRSRSMLRGEKLSKLRGSREVTRSDIRSSTTLKKGLLRYAGTVRFVTLTGADMKSFRRLKRWLGLKCQAYFGVRTGEGGGVIHLVYAGLGVRWGDLSKKWNELTGKWIVSIRKVKDPQGIMRELLLQHKKIRYFHSSNWAEPKKSEQNNLDGEIVKVYSNDYSATAKQNILRAKKKFCSSNF
jgi:hypothetical protein